MIITTYEELKEVPVGTRLRKLLLYRDQTIPNLSWEGVRTVVETTEYQTVFKVEAEDINTYLQMKEGNIILNTATLVYFTEDEDPEFVRAYCKF